MTSNLKICSMNVRGISERSKRCDLFSWLRKKKYSIYCLQDIHVGSKYDYQFKTDWGGEAILNTQQNREAQQYYLAKILIFE